MARNHYPFWTHDTVAAAVLAGVGTASFQSRLDAWAANLNIPVVTALVHGWPKANGESERSHGYRTQAPL